MTIAERIRPVPPDVKQLRNGDRMSADEFHRIYTQSPEGFKAELVGGVVYVASPLGWDHATSDGNLVALLATYAGMTPGVACGHNATVRLGPNSEPQPDIVLRLLPECGGHSTIEDNYVVGAPELVAEIAHTSWAIDLGSKYDDYRKHGVREYVVLDLHDRVVGWFDLKADQELAADADGVIRVKTFPGLWLNAVAILAGDFKAMRATLEAGMGTNEYAEFAKRFS